MTSKKKKTKSEKAVAGTAATSSTPAATKAAAKAEQVVKSRKSKGDSKASSKTNGDTKITMPSKGSTNQHSVTVKSSDEQVLLRRLEQELLEHNEFFDMLVDMIPSKLYISGESGDDYNPSSTRYHKGVSETSKEARKLQAKTAKRRKLDPEAVETTVQVKARMEKVQADAKDVDDDDGENGVDAAIDMGIDDNEPQPSVDVTEASSSASNIPSGLSRIEALRAKLHAKIAAKQQRSGFAATNNDNSSEAVSKRAARRVEKNRRKEEAKRKSKASSTNNTTTTTTQPKSYVVTPAMSDADSMLHDLQHIDFGRLTGLSNSTTGGGTGSGSAIDTKNYTQANKSLQSVGKAKNLHKLLADAEAKRLKLQQLQASSDEADKQKAALMEWKDTFKEADGVRVKDDPVKLKKAMKRKEAVKKKSQKAWKARIDQQTSSSKQRQDIRRHNLQARKQGGSVGANLSSKKIKDNETAADGSNKGRRLSRAGFEGRKQDFLNSSKKESGGTGTGGTGATGNPRGGGGKKK